MKTIYIAAFYLCTLDIKRAFDCSCCYNLPRKDPLKHFIISIYQKKIYLKLM